MLCADELDWVAKLRLLEGYRDREPAGWASPSSSWWTCSTPTYGREKGLYPASSPRVDERLLDDDQVTVAMTEPPEDTRAYFRGRCLAKYAPSGAASWDSVIFDVGRGVPRPVCR
jgi:proteasome accessory factor A